MIGIHPDLLAATFMIIVFLFMFTVTIIVYARKLRNILDNLESYIGNIEKIREAYVYSIWCSIFSFIYYSVLLISVICWIVIYFGGKK